MNKALIEKALKEGTLRHVILRDLGVGTHVVAGSGYQGKVLAHRADQVVFGWDSGVVNSFAYDELHQIYLTPLCFVEDKPVYKGSVLYWQNSNQVTVRCLSKDGTFLLFEEGGGWNLGDAGHISKLSWTKPVTTIYINGHEVPMPEREAPDEGTEYFFPFPPHEGGVYRYIWASDGTEWTNKAHRDRYEEERQLAKELTPLMNKPMELASWILENFQRKEF